MSAFDPLRIFRLLLSSQPKGGVMTSEAKSWLGLGIALLLPALSSVALAVLPWAEWLPDTTNLGRRWLYVTVLIGAMGILLAPALPWVKVLGILLYLPIMFLILAFPNVVLVCIAHGPSACP
jgi:hypothetical protein